MKETSVKAAAISDVAVKFPGSSNCKTDAEEVKEVKLNLKPQQDNKT